MVLVQKWPFLQLFFLGNIGQENVFYDILEPKNYFLRKTSQAKPVKWFYHVVEGKNAFLGYKIKKFKKSKNWDFSKGFGPKMAILPIFF